MKLAVLALTAVFLSPAPAPSPDHGGKIDWVRDVPFGLAKARLEGRAAMLFFTVDWCSYCKDLGAGAFSDEKVVTAATRVVPIYLDCTKDDAYADERSKYGAVFPSVVFLDLEGKKMREVVGFTEAREFLNAIEGVAKKLPGKPSLWSNTLASAAAAAKAAKKPVALYVAKPGADPIKVTAGLVKNLGDRRAKFAWAWKSGDDETVKALELEASPATVIYAVDDKDQMTVTLKFTLPEKDEFKRLNEGLDEVLKPKK